MSNEYSALLISAGMARRMYPHTIDYPKCLLEVKGKLTILDYQIKALMTAGFKKIYMILGFKAKLIIDFINKRNYEIPVETIYNPFYEVSNNLASLWIGLKDINEPLITINGDNIFSDQILRELLQADGDINLTISQKRGYDEDDMKIILNKDDSLAKIGKKLPINEAEGESIGMIKYSLEGIKSFKDKMDEMIFEDHNNINKFYLQVIQSLADEGKKIKTVKVDKDGWREFDYAEDLSNVRHELQKGLLKGEIFHSYE